MSTDQGVCTTCGTTRSVLDLGVVTYGDTVLWFCHPSDSTGPTCYSRAQETNPFRAALAGEEPDGD